MLSIAAEVLGERLAGIDPVLAQPLISAQVMTKSSALRAQHPDAVTVLVTEDAAPLGYVVTERSPGVVRLCDIAVSTRARGTGVGAGMLAEVIEQADAAEDAIELSVWWATPAREWYEHHGFRICGGDRDAYVEMRREPAGV